MNDIQQICERLGVGRTTVYRLLNTGALGQVRVGRRRFSTDKQLDDYISKLEVVCTSSESA
ncbi:helix-turn-helix domain-containing protein [Mycobacterium sp. SM3041]|uniref:helix-turn-helix domain-containing protein n=1 Tax=Mycobacterium sp. SM3041 TaxID=3114291 RepID=UPI003204DB73